MRNAVALLAFAPVVWAQADALWTVETSMKVQKVAEVAPSADRRIAAWTQTKAVIENEKSENLTHIYLWRGGKATQLTRGEKSAQDPSFTPDGKWLLFTSDRSGKKNLFRIPLDGGEAEMLTDWKGAMGAYRVSPDGKWIAFAGAEADSESEKAVKEKRDVKVVDENPRNHALWVTALSGERAKARKIGSGSFHVGEFHWSPDSRRIAFQHQPTPDFEVSRKADLSEVEVESGTVKAIAATAATEAQPRYSPDGRYLAFVRSAQKPALATGSRLVLMDRASGKVRELGVTPEEQPQVVDWAADSSRIYVQEPLRTRSVVYAVPVDGPVVVAYQTQRGVARVTGLSRDGKWAGAVAESASDAPEAFLIDMSSAQRKRVSEANQWPMPKLGETRVVTWKSKDGKPVEGLITLPVNYEAGKRYPLALIIHGGPAGVYAESFIGASGATSVATFAAKGYAVLRSNPRGSVGYGRAFRASNYKDWGGGDFQDIMSGVDYVIAQGIADADHMAVMGWSYGGYMTAWTISQTQRFKAAIVGAGITNVWSMWGTNDIPSVLDDYFGGSPWDEPELYMKRSGLFHVKQVTTPTLFLHGEADFRVPVGQAYEYYHALKRRGVTTKMVVYPRTPHGPQEPKFVQDVMQRHLDWVEQYAR
ncbi:MAG: S9 family peptidase [Acidobacteria bacterium]|nr:S9 family peptidase [Acidobacteriota bacterium]